VVGGRGSAHLAFVQARLECGHLNYRDFSNSVIGFSRMPIRSGLK
jgi:hypothetical protein